MITQIPANGDILQLLTPGFAQCTKLFFLLNTAISPATQISRNSRSTTQIPTQNLQDIFAGGFVFRQIMQFNILNPNSAKHRATEKIL